MARGLPKSIIKKYGISKKAWSVYRGRSNKPRASAKSKSKSRRSTKTPRKRGRRRYGMTIPLAPIAGLAVGMANPVKFALAGNLEAALKELGKNYAGIGWDGQFNPMHLKNGLLPLVIGGLVHKFVGGPPININRMLGRARVPFIRI